MVLRLFVQYVDLPMSDVSIAVFDESGNFVIYATMLGIKGISLSFIPGFEEFIITVWFVVFLILNCFNHMQYNPAQCLHQTNVTSICSTPY